MRWRVLLVLGVLVGCGGEAKDPEDVTPEPIEDADGDGVLDATDVCDGGSDLVDTDEDGVPDFCDPCPADASDDSDGDGICDSDDVCPGADDTADSDGDGVADGCDPCPSDDPDDSDGDGVCDTDDLCVGDDGTGDSDGDGVCDSDDGCPLDDPDDSDGDGVCDSDDPCPLDDPDDSDGDGVCDSDDPCPLDNPDDLDGDGICESSDLCFGDDGTGDSDGDGVCDSDDGCPLDNPDDSDADGVCDSDDVCPGSDDTVDSDGDGVADGCDPCPSDNPDDSDGDGVCDTDDLCFGDDGTGDTDGDGVCDSDDVCPLDNPDDSDGDGVCDSDDVCPGGSDEDGNGNTVPDGCDPCFSYTTLDDPSRAVTNGAQGFRCDINLSGWFRFEGASGDRMLDFAPPSSDMCGTQAPGWLDGSHPVAAQGIVTRPVCYSWLGNTCNWTHDVEVLECGGYYVYELSGTPTCDLGYCGVGALDPQCSEPYTVLTGPERHVEAANTSNDCDLGLFGWYGFEGDLRMATDAVAIERCGADAPGFIDSASGGLPHWQEGVVDRDVCFHWSGNECFFSSTIKAVNCMSHTLYEYSGTPTCSLTYCNEDTVSTFGDSTFAGIVPPDASESALVLDGPQYRYGAAWYLTSGGVSCDAACEDVGGSNLADSMEDEFFDDDNDGFPDTNCGVPTLEDVGGYWADNDNPGQWSGVGPFTSYHTLGYAYEGGEWYSACSTGLFTGAGTYPGDDNNNVTRNVMCPCHAMAGGPVNFKAQFTGNASAPAAVEAAWVNFQEQILDLQANGREFDRVTLRGSLDSVGLSCVGPEADLIAANLGSRLTTTVVCGGHEWNLGEFSGWMAISVDASGAGCDDPAYILRPDIGAGNANWGGINGATCGAPSQTIELIFD